MKCLWVEPVQTERWTSIDTDVIYNGGKILRDASLPFSNLSTHVVLREGILSLLT